MEYQNTGAADKNNDKDAACVVCELDRWEEVYNQWGRSDTCTNGHQTLYKGYIMGELYTHNKGEFLCVDSARKEGYHNNNGNQNGGLLYTTEMEQGSTYEAVYPHDYEVGCSVCAAIKQENELPFAAIPANLILGEWVKLRTLSMGQEVTIEYGYESSSGTSTSHTEEETKESAYTHTWDVSVCFSTEFEKGAIFAKTKVGLEVCAGYGGEAMDSVAKTTAKETSDAFEYTFSQSMSDTFSVPDSAPPGTPQASVIATHGVHLWQWQYTIVEGPVHGRQERKYTAKANSHYVYSPNDPADGQPKRPCCMPGQEYGLWFPFNCKSTHGFVSGASNAAHCNVGRPDDATSGIAKMSQQEIIQWLRGLSLSADYSNTVSQRGITGPALAALALILDKASIGTGSDPAYGSFDVVKDTFGITTKVGDALIIMKAMYALFNSQATR
jgi:hypothetical protein